MEPRPIVFKEWRDARTFSNLKSNHCTLLILFINLVTKKSLCITSFQIKSNIVMILTNLVFAKRLTVQLHKTPVLLFRSIQLQTSFSVYRKLGIRAIHVRGRKQVYKQCLGRRSFSTAPAYEVRKYNFV
jgi:hypothetical protein